MAFAQAARLNRPIPGAVATVGVSDRVAFLRKTYAHLGGALVAFALLTAGMMKYATGLSLKLAFAGSQGMGSAVLVLLLFIGISYGAQRLAMSETSRGLQYLGLGLTVLLWSILAQPIIWFTLVKFGSTGVLSGEDMLSAKAAMVLGEATVLTLAIFLGLTLTVFYTRKDFSFLGGILSIAMWAMVGVALASWIFGFNIGMIYSGIIVMIMAGYILFQTSLVMKSFRPTMYVAAALMLFTTVVMLFIHLLRILAEANRR